MDGMRPVAVGQRALDQRTQVRIGTRVVAHQDRDVGLGVGEHAREALDELVKRSVYRDADDRIATARADALAERQIPEWHRGQREGSGAVPAPEFSRSV